MSDTAVEIGIVTKIEGEKALVKIVESGDCDHCAAKFLCNPGKEGAKEIVAFNQPKAAVGDRVQLEDLDHLLLKMGILQFGLPLLGLILGILGVNLFDLSKLSYPKELLMTLGGLLGVLLAGFVSRQWAKKITLKTTCLFRITSIVKE